MTGLHWQFSPAHWADKFLHLTEPMLRRFQQSGAYRRKIAGVMAESVVQVAIGAG